MTSIWEVLLSVSGLPPLISCPTMGTAKLRGAVWWLPGREPCSLGAFWVVEHLSQAAPFQEYGIRMHDKLGGINS